MEANESECGLILFNVSLMEILALEKKEELEYLGLFNVSELIVEVVGVGSTTLPNLI